jgi:hypothetical protein
MNRSVMWEISSIFLMEKLSDVFIPDKDNPELTVGYFESAKCFLTKINQI